MTAGVPEGGRRSRPRDRILAAAADLFVREGINAVGVDRLSAQAGVSKRSLYQHFGTKDAVVAEMLERHGTELAGGTLPPEDDDAEPRARIMAVFEGLSGLSADEGFVGCPFVNVSSELRDARDHPAVAVARAAKARLTAYFERQLSLAGARDAAAGAVQLTMLFDGAAGYAVMFGGGVPTAALDAARTLTAAA